MLIIFILFFSFVSANIKSPGHRNEIGKILEKEGHKIGVELGVQRGHFVDKILTNWKSCERFYLVDIWAQLDNYIDNANMDNVKQEAIYQECKRVLSRFDQNKLVYIRNFTINATPLIKDTLDFVYIDARHDYCGVTEDINAYWPKIKSGGILSGHDYLNVEDVKRMTPNQDWGICEDGSRNEGAVKGAVDDFAKKHNLTVTFNKEEWPTWFIRKP